MWRLAFVIGCTACGRLRFDAEASRDAAAGDAPADAQLGPWMPPSPLGVSPSGDDPTITPDLLELYYNRSSVDLYASRRVAPTDPWPAGQLVAELDDAANQSSPRLSYDGRTIYIASERSPTLGGSDIWVSTRGALGGTWGAPVYLAELSSSAGDHPGGQTADGLMIAIDSHRTANTDDDVFIATRTNIADPWGTPVEVAEIDTTGTNDESPWLSPDGLTIYFDSNRTGDADLYVARRSSVDEPFSAPEPITELESSSTDADPSVSADGHHIVFYSGRSPGGLWEAWR